MVIARAVWHQFSVAAVQCGSSAVWKQCSAVGFGSLEAAAPPIALISCQRCLGEGGGGCDRRVGLVIAVTTVLNIKRGRREGGRSTHLILK